jgi:hypothetical protein
MRCASGEIEKGFRWSDIAIEDRRDAGRGSRVE